MTRASQNSFKLLPLSFFVFLLALVSTVPISAAENQEAQVAIGQGSGKLSNQNGVYTLTAKATGSQEYSENNKYPATVFDYRLSDPIPLPMNSDRISFQYSIDPQKIAQSEAMLRVLVRDARGGEWAVGTRLGGGLSQVAPTKGFEALESYGWKVSELGRIDPWVMTSLDPKKFDEYTPPQPPLSVVGFRLIMTKGTDYEVLVRNIQNITQGAAPSPYWWITFDNTYSARKGVPYGGFTRYGWAPQYPQPYLKAVDLALANGKYEYTWEILSTDEARLLHSGAGQLQVETPADSFKLPLLNPGSYLLRIFTRGESDKVGKDALFQYVVVRNSEGESSGSTASSDKPLQGSFGPKNVLKAGSPVIATIQSKLPGTIQWVVESSDKKLLLQGTSPVAAGEKLKIDLTKLAGEQPALWFSATLLKDDIELDKVRRIVGYRTEETPPGPALGGPASKLDPLRSNFRRTRADAGLSVLTFIATDHDKTMATMMAWLDEAKVVGYNIVEIWVPWFDLEPLPGVYQYHYLDPLIQEAEKRGLHIVLRLNPMADMSPSWVAQEFQENQYCLSQGTWGGQSQKMWSLASTSLRTNYYQFLQNIATHYRSHPMVLGYTLDNIFCDHGMLDQPDLGQHMDYSAAMHAYYINFLREKYSDNLAELSRAHHHDYRDWQSVVIPQLNPEFDKKGRIIPCQSQEGLDFADCKRQVVERFRTDGNDALRRGDPACIVGPYADTSLDFDSRIYAETKCFVPEGSMEEQFPVEPHDYMARSEPITYVEGSIIADVGITNIAFHKFGWNEFNNYWFPARRIADAPPLLKESELRLGKWFSVLDQMKGIKESDEGKAEKLPVVIGSLETLIYTWKTVFTSRMTDSVAPFFFQAGREKVRAKFAFSADITAESLVGCPFVYLPYGSDTLDQRLRNILDQYVSGGGKLIMEWSSGYWEAGKKTGNTLGSDLGLPDVSPLDIDQPSTVAEVNPEGPLGKTALSFRTREFQPPIEDQPVAWIHTIPRCYFKLCSIDGALPAGAVTVAQIDKKPVAYLAAHGKGQVLFFAGAIDWLSCPGLVTQINAWGINQTSGVKAVSDPEMLVSNYTRGNERFAFGRRFINHTLISSILREEIPDECKVKKTLAVPILADAGVKYSVQELLSGSQLGQYDGAALRNGAVSLPLGRGEGFVLRATPLP
jgi:hypothetical protein